MECSVANPSIPADLPSLVYFKLLSTSLAAIVIWESESTASIWSQTKPYVREDCLLIIIVGCIVFLIYLNPIASVACLFLEEFLHFLNCCANLYLNNELITVQILLLERIYLI